MSKNLNKVFLYSSLLLGLATTAYGLNAVNDDSLTQPATTIKADVVKGHHYLQNFHASSKNRLDITKNASRNGTKVTKKDLHGKTPADSTVLISDGGGHHSNHYKIDANGNPAEGAPAHNGILVPHGNGPAYSYDLGIGHSQLERHDLQQIDDDYVKYVNDHGRIKKDVNHSNTKDDSLIRITNPKGGDIKVLYPDSAYIRGVGRVSTVVTISSYTNTNSVQAQYDPWRGDRSFVFSRNLAGGYYYNGYTNFITTYKFLDRNGNKVNVLPNDVMRFRQINGLEKYGHVHRLGTNAWRNNVRWNNDAYYHYDANTINDRKNTSSHIGEGITNAGGHIGWSANEFAPKYSNIRLYSSTSKVKKYRDDALGKGVTIGGRYGIPRSGDNNDIYFKGNKGLDVFAFNMTSSTGYGSVRPDTPGLISPIKVNYYRCMVKNNKEVIMHYYGNPKHPHSNQIRQRTFLKKHLTPKSLGFVGKHKKDAYKYITKKGHFRTSIVKGKSDNGLSAMRAWLSSKGCKLAPQKGQKQYPKIKKVPPVEPTPIKKSVSGKIYHTKIDKRNGGRLSHPNQSYDYNITGQLPDLNDHRNEEYHVNWYQDKNSPIYGYYNYYDEYGMPQTATYISSYNWKYYLTWHYDNNDHYDIKDYLPKEVSITKLPTLSIGHKTITGKLGKDNSIDFNLDAAQMHEFSNDNYNATVPVIANNLPKANTKGWETYWNGGDGTELNKNTTEANVKIGYDDDANPLYSTTVKPSNHVPVDIKKIQDTLYHYAWNPNKENQYDQFFPEEAQSLGVKLNDNDKLKNGKIPDPLEFKNYRFHKYFDGSKGNQDVLQTENHVGYVGSTFAEPELNKKNGKHGQYHFAYPSYPSTLPKNMTYNPTASLYSKDFTTNESNLTNNSKSWRGATSITPTKNDNNVLDGKHTVPIDFNPNHGDAYTGNDTGNPANDDKNNFNQTNYLPYIIPTVRINQPNHYVNPHTPSNPNDINAPKHTADTNGDTVSNGDRASRFVIDTDSKAHGLPFHLDTMSENDMYDALDYARDYGNVDVKLKITDPVTKKTLYSAIRPLYSSDNTNKDNLTTSGHHQLTNNEWPQGIKEHQGDLINGQWNGYIDRDALQADTYDHRTDLKASTKRGGRDAKNGGFGIKAHFSIVKSSNPEGINLSARNIYTHAYTAQHPKLNKYRFGKTYSSTWTGNDASGHSTWNIINNDTANSNNIKTATYILPERTIKYGKHNSPVRELKEQFDMTQPRNQETKAGLGMRANDIKIDYQGHLDASKYSHMGTSLLTAYPKDFNAKDSQITDPTDPYNHHFLDKYDDYKQNFLGGKNLNDGKLSNDTKYDSKNKRKDNDDVMLAAPMVHNDANFSNDENTDGENFNLPDNLDTAKDNSKDVSADSYYDNNFKDNNNLIGGSANTSYGYTPKAMTTNNGSRYLSGNLNNGGVAFLINPNKSGQIGKHGYYPSWDDPSLSNKANYISDEDNDTQSVHTNTYKHTYQNGHLITSLADSLLDKNGNPESPTMTMSQNNQNERLYLQQFLQDDKYPMYFESAYKNTNSDKDRSHRLGGNFINVDEQDPVTVYAHNLITKTEGTFAGTDKYWVYENTKNNHVKIYSDVKSDNPTHHIIAHLKSKGYSDNDIDKYVTIKYTNQDPRFNAKEFDEFSPQPILTDTKARYYKGNNNLNKFAMFQIPKEYPELPAIAKNTHYNPNQPSTDKSFDPSKPVSSNNEPGLGSNPEYVSMWDMRASNWNWRLA